MGKAEILNISAGEKALQRLMQVLLPPQKETAYPLLTKTISDDGLAVTYHFPDGKEVSNLTHAEQGPIDIFTSNPNPSRSEICSHIEKFFPDNKGGKTPNEVKNRIHGTNNKLRIIGWRITNTELGSTTGRHSVEPRYVICQIDLQSKTEKPVETTPNFPNSKEVAKARAGLRKVSDREKDVWRKQAETEKEKMAVNLAKIILTHAAYQTIEQIDSNLLTLLKAAMPSSSLERPVNLGLLTTNDPRVEDLITREEIIGLFKELLPKVEEIIKSYWNLGLDYDTPAQSRLPIKACGIIKRKDPNATPERIMEEFLGTFLGTVLREITTVIQTLNN